MSSELTEITETTEGQPLRGWIFYDRDCCTCRDLALRLEDVAGRRGFRFEPLQEQWVQRRLNLTPAEALEEMRVLTVTGEVCGGADAIIFLARQIWWMAPLHTVARLPAFRSLLDRIYRWLAAHRTCTLPSAVAPSVIWRTRGLALITLPILALLTKPLLPAWGFMWAMAFALFFGCKWLTLGLAIQRRGVVFPFRAAAYLTAWPGMDAARFLSSKLAPRCPKIQLLKDTLRAVSRMLIGFVLLFVVARRADEPLLAGWIGMFGMILLLHFGLFQLASLGWRLSRVDAPPIMHAPLRSASVSEFWGRRWNGAFNNLAFRLIFRPLARRAGTVAATLGAFLVSGLIHELVISLPANAGYGLPTSYFGAQGVAILLQRRGWFTGRIFTIAVVAAPAFWLFHPPFIGRVILPFMQATGAL